MKLSCYKETISYIGAWYPRSHANSVRLRYARAYLIGLRYARASFIQRYYHCFGRVVNSHLGVNAQG